MDERPRRSPSQLHRARLSCKRTNPSPTHIRRLHLQYHHKPQRDRENNSERETSKQRYLLLSSSVFLARFPQHIVMWRLMRKYFDSPVKFEHVCVTRECHNKIPNVLGQTNWQDTHAYILNTGNSTTKTVGE